MPRRFTRTHALLGAGVLVPVDASLAVANPRARAGPRIDSCRKASASRSRRHAPRPRRLRPRRLPHPPPRRRRRRCQPGACPIRAPGVLPGGVDAALAQNESEGVDMVLESGNDLPQSARRSLDRVGLLTPDIAGLGDQAFGTLDGAPGADHGRDARADRFTLGEHPAAPGARLADRHAGRRQRRRLGRRARLAAAAHGRGGQCPAAHSGRRQ